jgi:DNA-directed RNA polymerase subunit RPC12/RpoP
MSFRGAVGKEIKMGTSAKEAVACQHCGAEADITLEGFEGVKDVLKRQKKLVCKSCGREILTETSTKETPMCQHCGAEADMTLEGLEAVEDVIKRGKKLTCKSCGGEMPWTAREDLKAVKVAMEAEKEAYQSYAKAAKQTKNPKGKEMFQQLSEFEMNHYQRLKELSKSLAEKGEWILYSGTTLKKKAIPLKAEKAKGQDQLTDMDALKMAVKEEKKAQILYRSMADLTKDPRGRDMYKRLADEEALHEKLLNDQYYSLHNTGIWSWGD